MEVSWLDVVKLTIPFLTAISMVWIKSWGEMRLARKNKQHALSRLISDDLHSLHQSIHILKLIAESAAQGKLRLVSVDLSSLISKFAYDLSDLDARQAYAYADLASCVEIVNKGLTRLSSLVLSRAAAQESSVRSQIDRVIIGQSKITAVDLMSLSKTYFKVIQVIPLRRRYVDPQALNALQEQCEKAEKETRDWPVAPAVLAQAEPSTVPKEPLA